MKKFITFFSFLFVFTMFFACSTYAAETNYPEKPNIDGDYKYVYFDTGEPYFVVFRSSDNDFSDLKLYYEKDNNHESFIAKDLSSSGKFTYSKYFYRNNQWNVESVNSTLGSALFYYKSLIETSVNIYTALDSDEVFFSVPLPPPLTVEMMVAEEAPKMGERIIQVMKIILLCGVGCLALLMALPILVKVLRRFL